MIETLDTVSFFSVEDINSRYISSFMFRAVSKKLS